MAPKRRTSLADMAKSKGSNRGNLDGLKKEITGLKEPTKRLNAEIPESLYKSFKSRCAANGESVTAAVTRLLEGELGVNE